MVSQHNAYGNLFDSSSKIPEMPQDPSDDELIERAAWLGSQPPDARRHTLLNAGRIMGTVFDRPVPKGVENPYWEIIRRLPASLGLWRSGLEPDCFLGIVSHGIDLAMQVSRTNGWTALERQNLCRRYTWAIPSPGSIDFIRNNLCGQPLVEICAGSGYWAWQLNQAGVDVDAYDPKPPGPENWFNQRKLYFPVKQDDHTVVGGYPDRALMISWPNYEADYANEALSLYKGDTIVYIGETLGGCCANDDFFATLNSEWELDADYAAHVQWSGLHDHLEIWRRKNTGTSRRRRVSDETQSA